MRHPRILVGAAALVCAHALVGAHACAQAVCAEIDYRDPECRVVAENEVARRRSASGVELRFQEPAARSSES